MAKVVIDLGSDSEEEANPVPQAGPTFAGASSEIGDTKPDVRNLPVRKSLLGPVTAAGKQAAESERNGGAEMRIGSERPLKRVKTEHTRFPEEDVMEGEAIRGQGAKGGNLVWGTVRKSAVALDIKPKLEFGAPCAGQKTPDAPPAPKGSLGSPEKEYLGSKSRARPSIMEPINAPKGVDGGISEPDPDGEVEGGEIAEDKERSVEELEEEVQRHTELLRQKQEELERRAAASSPVEEFSVFGERGNENGALVPSVVPDVSDMEGILRRARGHRQFWHAGEYEVQQRVAPDTTGSMAHVRVHPKFLHSNATSHKWALGAVAELLDNAVDEVQNGATFVSVDMERNPRPAFQGEPMLVVEDDGGGMDPDRLRKCMSLGYSAKSKMANTIGQYGNGFKTSTMRLGADVIVFTRCPGAGGAPASQSIGLLSFTFLKKTGHEDIVVPMVDFEIDLGGHLHPILAGSLEDHDKNLETICEWSPFASKEALLDQFASIGSHGTRVVIFNLWENDDGFLELDFETDPRDIFIRGGSRDEDMEKAALFPDSHFYLTYMHSLRSYASILYLALPPGFRMFLRGTEIQHHRLADDLRYAKEMPYRPQTVEGEASVVTQLGFWKDSPPLDVQGFNVYHKNRLIKPFWRVWNSASSNGRGVVGVLEANFVEPAHDKQGFESTPVLQRLEKWLARSQKAYWNEYCTLVGYQGVGRMKKPKPGSDPAYHAPSTAKRPQGILPGTPNGEEPGLESPGVGEPGMAFAQQQQVGRLSSPRFEGGAFEGLSKEGVDPNLGETPRGFGAIPDGGSVGGGKGPTVCQNGGTGEKQVREVSDAVVEKDRRILDLEGRVAQLSKALSERQTKMKEVEAEVEKGQKTSRLLNVAVNKLKDMKALLAAREATTGEQKKALEVAETDNGRLRDDVSKAKAEVEKLLAAQKERDEEATRELEAERARGVEKVSELLGELSKERRWNAERALQLNKVEEELSAVLKGGPGAGLVRELEAEKKRGEEKLRLLAKDFVALREKHRVALDQHSLQLEEKGGRIEYLERQVRDLTDGQETAEGLNQRERLEVKEVKQEPCERETGLGKSRNGLEAAKKARRASESSEVLEGGAKGAIMEERSVSQRSTSMEEVDLRAEMRRMKEEIARMKERMLSKEES